MCVSGPISSKILWRDALEFDLMLFPILFSGFSVNDLGGVEMGRSGEDRGSDLWGELADGESPTGAGYKSGCHRSLKCKYIVKSISQKTPRILRINRS